MLTALHHGAAAIVPVAEISEALALRARQPDLLLAGERGGLRITALQSGGVEFDLGNSPRELTATRVRGRTIAMTTTNGTRALRACLGAARIWVGGLVNLDTLAVRCDRTRPSASCSSAPGRARKPPSRTRSGRAPCATRSG